MSWSYNKSGRASKLAAVVKSQILEVGGCPKGSAEEAAKNALAEVAETLCKSLTGNSVVRVDASGSAWTEGDKVRNQFLSFKLETLSDFIE